MAAVRRLRERLSVEMRGLRGSNAMAVIARLTPIIRGWAAYYRGVVSSKTFHALDYHVWKLAYKWAKHTHPNKSKWWICNRYFGMFNKFRNDRWVFGARDRIDDQGAVPYLIRFSWTDIVRHQMVQGTASPDDPDLAQYWTARRRRVKPPWTTTRCACSIGNAVFVHCVQIRCSPLISHRKPHTSGNDGG